MSVKLKAFSYVPAHDEVKWQENFHPTVYIKKHKTSQCLYELSASEIFSR